MIKLVNKPEEATFVTHGGTFHADDVFATVILEKVFGDITVCRCIKVPEKLATDVIVYDIGYGMFDHHQKGGNGQRKNGVPYAACGLIWEHYGKNLFEKRVWEMVDQTLIQGIDAVDNGMVPHYGDYPAKIMSISGIISGFNPTWNSNITPDEAFKSAVTLAKTVFDNCVANAIATVEASEIVEDAINKSQNGIMILKSFVPWQNAIFSSTNHKADDILYVVFPSNRGGYNFQCVPDAPGSFGMRQPLPVEWRGLVDEALQGITGVKDATFCHQVGFIGSSSTEEGAIKLAQIAASAK